MKQLFYLTARIVATLFVFNLCMFSAISQPVNPFPVPEYTSSEAVIIRYPFNNSIWHIYEQLIMECQEAAHTVLLVNNASEKSTLENLINAAGIPMDNITLLTIPANRMWVRDHGPLAIDTDQGKAFINFLDYNNSGFHDQNLPVSLAQHWGYQHYSIDWILDGGNYLVDSYGTLFTTTRLYTNNPDLDPEVIDQMLADYMGITNIVTVSPKHDDYWGHIDMQIKLLNDTTFVVSSVESGPNYAILESNVAILESLTAPNGNPYHIERLPKADNWKTYANALILNNKVILPVYGHPNDQIAIDTYSELMPDHTVVGINCNSIIQWGGAIHCITMQIFGESGMEYLLSLQTEGHGSLSVDNDLYLEPVSVAQGGQAWLEALPAEGYTFDGWSGDIVSSANPLEVTVQSHMNLTARFERLPHTYLSFLPQSKGTYESSNGHMHFARIDSVSNHVKDTTKFYFARQLRQTGPDCYTPYGKSWLGEKFVMLNNGDDLFFNHMHDTIRIRTRAQVGDSWQFFKNENRIVMAEVLNHESTQWQGQADSIKTIGFQAYDLEMNPVNHSVNNRTIELSKTFGLVSTFGFYDFPEQTSIISLAGSNNPALGVPNLSKFHIFDFQPGDQLHTYQEHKETDPDGAGYHTETQMIQKFQNRLNYPDSLLYVIERKIFEIHTTFPEGSSHQTYTHDTIYKVIHDDAHFNHFAAEPAFTQNGDAFLIHSQNRISNPPTVSKTINVQRFAQSQNECWSPVDAQGCETFPQTYYMGLGGPYYFCDDGSLNRFIRYPVYYQKGEHTWGTPLVITSVGETADQSLVQIYPNPASHKVYVKIPDTHLPATIELTSVSGQRVWHQKIHTSLSSWPVGHLPKGFYMYRIYDQNKVMDTGKLIIR